MKDLFIKRPFKTRNADEYNLSDILSLFVSPVTGLSSPLEFENSIVKGRMGSGKTMYLRANHAYYLFNLVPNIIDNNELVLPVFLRLSDFQNLQEPGEIYRAVIVKIVEELASIYLKLQDAREMAIIHLGMKRIKSDLFFEEKIRSTAKQLLKLGAEEYIEKISLEFGIEGKLTSNFLQASAKFHKSQMVEIKEKKSPGMGDISLAYETLLKDTGGKVLLLIDEAGSLDKRFFRSDAGESFFEILMNQLRTTEFIRTKVAIYPNSYSDILTETRYGDVVALEEGIDSETDYNAFRAKIEGIIGNYLNVSFEKPHYKVSDVFDTGEEGRNADTIEELINGSGGNYRRIIQLLDSAMDEAYRRGGGKDKVRKEDALAALRKHCQSVLDLFIDEEKEFLRQIARACRTRGTFRFKYPNNAGLLYKYMTKSQEFNLVKVVDAGSGRRGTTYAFDYAYCVYQEIPTHHIKNSERIDKARSIISGNWISRTTTLNEEIIAQSQIPSKIEGEISYLTDGKGFVKCSDGSEYFFSNQFILETDKNKNLYSGRRLRFNPSLLGDSKMAMEIEVI